tara:strand:+ start:374 stop:568 length:195 start_codon:yes stop_codon:yes gene_type:complete
MMRCDILHAGLSPGVCGGIEALTVVQGQACRKMPDDARPALSDLCALRHARSLKASSRMTLRHE